MTNWDGNGDKPTKMAGSNRPWGLGVNADDARGEQPTRMAGAETRRSPDNAAQSGASAAAAEDPKTRLFKAPSAPGKVDFAEVPVGWLLVVAGPGFGKALPLFYGANRIGRGAGVEVPLNFGDESISRGAHARITYDTKGRAFYLQPGEGTGLTYSEGGPVLVPVALSANMQIEVGHTTLRFIPICSPDFDWQDLPGAKDGQP
jgi:hypothetical protein